MDLRSSALIGGCKALGVRRDNPLSCRRFHIYPGHDHGTRDAAAAFSYFRVRAGLTHMQPLVRIALPGHDGVAPVRQEFIDRHAPAPPDRISIVCGEYTMPWSRNDEDRQTRRPGVRPHTPEELCRNHGCLGVARLPRSVLKKRKDPRLRVEGVTKLRIHLVDRVAQPRDLSHQQML